MTMAGGITGGAVNPAIAIVQPYFQVWSVKRLLPNFDVASIQMVGERMEMPKGYKDHY